MPPIHPARRWRPTPLIWLTLVLHASVCAVFVWRPSLWLVCLLILFANHGVLTVVGLWPRSQLLGFNLRRLPDSAIRSNQIALTIDDGPDPHVTPHVLDILDQYGAQATFFCIGTKAECYPDLCQEIIRRGHAVENHSQHHFHHFSVMGPWRMAKEVEAGQTTLTRITGQRPLFFRPTAGLRNPFLEPILARHGLILASWTRRGFDTREGNPEIVLRRLTQRLAAGDILLLHDSSHAARTAQGAPVILSVLPRLLDAAQIQGLHTVTLRSIVTTFPA